MRQFTLVTGFRHVDEILSVRTFHYVSSEVRWRQQRCNKLIVEDKWEYIRMVLASWPPVSVKAALAASVARRDHAKAQVADSRQAYRLSA